MGTIETFSSITETKLKRIAWLSKQDSEKGFECLMHLFNKESLLECFHSLGKNKTVGIDGIDKAKYAENLEEYIDILERFRITGLQYEIF